MNLARVRGSVVAALRSDGVEGARFLLVEECDQGGEGRGEYLVALDMVDAARGQMVLLAQGSSCHWTHRTANRPLDALAVGIVDEIDVGGTTVWDDTRGER